jgi:hypothetical protein
VAPWTARHGESSLEGRLAAEQALQFGPDEFALRESHLQLGLDLTALHGVDGVPQLGAQFLDVLIDRHWSSP